MNEIRLSALCAGQTAVITKIESSVADSLCKLKDSDIQVLQSLGFFPGAIIKVEHEAPFGRDPIAVRVRGALIAIRRSDAEAIQVKLS